MNRKRLTRYLDYYVENEAAIHGQGYEGYKWEILRKIQCVYIPYKKAHIRNGIWDDDLEAFQSLVQTIYKNRIGSVILPFQLFCHAGRSTIPPFQRMVNKQKAEQNNSKTEAITVFVGIILPGYNFRCHPTLLSHNAEVCTERTDIIIVTDQDIAGIRLDEEITIIYVLIAVTVIVQFSKSIDDLDGSVANGGKTLKTNLLLFSASHKVIGEFFVSIRANIH